MFAFLPSLPGVDERPCPGQPGRHRPPPRRTQRLRARIRPALGAAGDDGLRPAGDHHRGRPADGAARRRRRDPPRRRGPAGRRADRPRAAARRRRRRRFRSCARPSPLSAPSSRRWRGPKPIRARCPTTWPRRSVRCGCSPRERVGLIGFASNATVPARRAGQGGHRSPVRRARRIQVGGKPFHRGRLHRRTPRGRHPDAGKPASTGVAGGRRITQDRSRRARCAGRPGAAVARRRRGLRPDRP